MKKQFLTNITIFILVVVTATACGATVSFLRRFTFDEGKSLSRWGRMVLNGEVDYKVLRIGDNGIVKAFSYVSCSALYYNVSYKLKTYPYLKWRWRATRFPDVSKAETAFERDDYAARVYVIFPFLTFSMSRFLEYVWSTDLPEGTILDSPYGSNVKIIVVRSGPQPGGKWSYECRNVYEDYAMAFGKEPTGTVGAVAIMCDADSTKSVAEAYFDDIEIAREP